MIFEWFRWRVFSADRICCKNLLEHFVNLSNSIYANLLSITKLLPLKLCKLLCKQKIEFRNKADPCSTISRVSKLSMRTVEQLNAVQWTVYLNRVYLLFPSDLSLINLVNSLPFRLKRISALNPRPKFSTSLPNRNRIESPPKRWIR